MHLGHLLQKQYKNEHGSAILESVLSMFALCIILFGLLQITIFYMTQMVSDFASFRLARSAMVGYTESLYLKECKASAIPASGKLVIPKNYFGDDRFSEKENNKEEYSPYERMRLEKFVIQDYLKGYSLLEYDYWSPDGHGVDGEDNKTKLTLAASPNGEMIDAAVSFKDFPVLFFPMLRDSIAKDRIDIKGSARIAKYYSLYLKD